MFEKLKEFLRILKNTIYPEPDKKASVVGSKDSTPPKADDPPARINTKVSEGYTSINALLSSDYAKKIALEEHQREYDLAAIRAQLEKNKPEDDKNNYNQASNRSSTAIIADTTKTTKPAVTYDILPPDPAQKKFADSVEQKMFAFMTEYPKMPGNEKAKIEWTSNKEINTITIQKGPIKKVLSFKDESSLDKHLSNLLGNKQNASPVNTNPVAGDKDDFSNLPPLPKTPSSRASTYGTLKSDDQIADNQPEATNKSPRPGGRGG